MTREEIGGILYKLRKAANMTREDVSLIIDKSIKTIGHWETGHAMPDANMLFWICQIYNADLNEAFGFPPSGENKKAPPMTDEAKELLELYNELNPEGQRQVTDYADTLVKSGKYPRASRGKKVV